MQTQMQQYLEILKYEKMPDFLKKYLMAPSLIRLKRVGYLCGMDYASKDIYDFKEYISRFDHSLTTALLTWHFTKDKSATIAALFHDVATPCFSHVIDYMNKDYQNQETTEEYTEKMIREDYYLRSCLMEDGIKIEDIINFKKYSIVDSERPKLCADRLDGVILTGLFCMENITINQVREMILESTVYRNEDHELEIGFKNRSTAELVVKTNREIDEFFHSNADNYMMELLASITESAMNYHYLSYEDLYYKGEPEIIYLFQNARNSKIREDFKKFTKIKKKEIPEMSLPDVKTRILRPLVNGRRI